jgi:hypothetical protein
MPVPTPPPLRQLQSVTFSPSTINCGVAQPGGTAAGVSQCAPVTASVNVTVGITNDTSGGAVTLLSVASYALEFGPPVSEAREALEPKSQAVRSPF